MIFNSPNTPSSPSDYASRISQRAGLDLNSDEQAGPPITQ